MLEFIGATYNEQEQIDNLILHVYNYADKIHFVDDGSTDETVKRINRWTGKIVQAPIVIEHTGLPEVVKARALQECDPDSWVMMLDADERYEPTVRDKIREFVTSDAAKNITHVWFTLNEYIDAKFTRSFQKCRLFRASAAHFSTSVHEDDTFAGDGAFFGWTVFHQKSKEKQIRRETEYLETYDKLLKEGKITEDRVRTLKGMHYFVK